MGCVFDIHHPVTGDLFHGRETELAFYRRELFEPAARGESRYYSITGMNRIGKSSLFQELCRSFREEGHGNVHVIEATLEGSKGFWDFWIRGVLQPLFGQLDLARLMEKMDSDDAEDVQEYRDYFLEKSNWRPLFDGDPVEDAVAKGYLERLFPILYDAGQYIILGIDEFDRAGRTFGQKEENFGWFRSLLQKNQGISVVTLSRRRIYYIEQNCFGGSTFDGIFSKRGLFGLTNQEMDAYFALLEERGAALSQEQRKAVWYCCGRSPYYLAIMGEEFLRSGTVNPDTVSSQFIDSFEKIISLLKEENLLTPMLQMFVGPCYNLAEADVQKLVAMGYCMKRSALEAVSEKEGQYTDYCDPENTGAYLTVCGYFIDYLNAVHQAEIDDIWPKLTHTERRLRAVIETEFKNLYGEAWKTQLEARLSSEPEARRRNDGFLREHDRVFRRAGQKKQEAVGNSLLNVISIKSLSYLIRRQWSTFEKYFGCGQEEFKRKMDTLYRARNPISHSNGELLTPEDIAAVELICDQFTAGIDRAT